MEQIYTIPVNEAFEKVQEEGFCTCPFCLMYNRLEDKELDLILGASMMEPDVRLKTNEAGFCPEHPAPPKTATSEMLLSPVIFEDSADSAEHPGCLHERWQRPYIHSLPHTEFPAHLPHFQSHPQPALPVPWNEVTSASLRLSDSRPAHQSSSLHHFPAPLCSILQSPTVHPRPLPFFHDVPLSHRKSGGCSL